MQHTISVTDGITFITPSKRPLGYRNIYTFMKKVYLKIICIFSVPHSPTVYNDRTRRDQKRDI